VRPDCAMYILGKCIKRTVCEKFLLLTRDGLKSVPDYGLVAQNDSSQKLRLKSNKNYVFRSFYFMVVDVTALCMYKKVITFAIFCMVYADYLYHKNGKQKAWRKRFLFK
jgi:hypothetical protein